jgi:plastocyanin
LNLTQAADQLRDILSETDGHYDATRQQHSDHVVGNLNNAPSVRATAGGSQTLSVGRFKSDKIEIHAGQTVEWNNQDPLMPHTITFGTEPANPIPASGNVTLDADGALHAVITSPSENAHSGFIVAAPQERIGLPESPLGFTRFRVTFPKAGVFPYICALHDNLGMKGMVIVYP